MEMRAAVIAGKNISTINEAKIMLKLLGPSLVRRLIDENAPNKGVDPEVIAEMGPREIEFKRDTNDRLKVWLSVLELVYKMENAESAIEGNPKTKPISEIIIRRGLDTDRIAVLISGEPSYVGGGADGTGGKGSSFRAISDSILERPGDLQDSEQGPSIRIIDDVEYRDHSQGERTAEL